MQLTTKTKLKTKPIQSKQAKPKIAGVPTTTKALSSVRSNLPIGIPIPSPMTLEANTK